MFYRLKSHKFTCKNLDMKQDTTEVPTRRKQKARQGNKYGAGSTQRQENRPDKLQSKERRRQSEDKTKQMAKQKERYQYIYHIFCS